MSNTLGDILKKEFLTNITESELADEVGVDVCVIKGIVNGDIRLTPSMAMKFGVFFNTTSSFWMDMQRDFDINKHLKDRND